ncbi:MAG TPA: hypothetical protein VGM51_03105 [Armatimonadota bacterium]|jgi:hypothetical protein
MRTTFIPIALALSVVAVGAHAQQAKPGGKVAEPTSTVALTVKGPQATMYLTVSATSADVRGLMRDIAKKIGATVYFSPSVTGSYTGSIEAVEPDAAMSTVAAAFGCKVVRFNLPQDAPVLTEAAAAKVYAGMLALPTAAIVSDAKSKRSMTVNGALGGVIPDGPVVYYVQGKLTPDQEEAGAEQRVAAKAAQANAPATAIQNAVTAFQAMSPQDRMQAMRDVQRQIIQNMSPQDRQALFNNMRSGRANRGNRGG